MSKNITISSERIEFLRSIMLTPKPMPYDPTKVDFNQKLLIELEDRYAKIDRREGEFYALPVSKEEILDSYIDLTSVGRELVNMGEHPQIGGRKRAVSPNRKKQPTSIEKMLIEIAKWRAGQAAFRDELIACYNGTCAVTGTTIEAVLQAAHIIPHDQGGPMTKQNGLLLRADIHALFDEGLINITIVDDKAIVVVDLSLQKSDEYGHYHGKDAHFTVESMKIPDRDALHTRLRNATLKYGNQPALVSW